MSLPVRQSHGSRSASMDSIDHYPSVGTGQVSSYSSQSLESFHRTSERLLYECINSITDLIHRQIQRARQTEFSSDQSKNDVIRSVFNIDPETRSSMRTLSTDAWSIFKSLTSLIKQRALASKSHSLQDSPGEAQRQQLDADELQHHLERLLSKVHELETSQQSGLNVTRSLNQLNDPAFNDYLYRLRNLSQPSFNGSSSGEIARKEADPVCHNTIQEVAEFAGQRNALQNMAQVLTELDSLVKDIDEVPREKEYNERDHSYDGSWSEKVLPPKKGRHLLGNIAINAENNGLDWTDDGRLSSTSNDSRAAHYSIRSGEGGNWDQWKFSTYEPCCLSSLAQYQQNTGHQPSDTETDIRAANESNNPSTQPSLHSDVIEAKTPGKQLKKVVDAVSRNTDEGYHTGKCIPSTESEPKARYSDIKYDFHDGTTLIYSKPKSDKSDPDRWKLTKVEFSDKDGSYTSPVREDFSASSQDISGCSTGDMRNENSHKDTPSFSYKEVSYVSLDESKYPWLESITLNPDMITSERTAHPEESSTEPKQKWTMDHSSLESCYKDGHDMADMYAYDNACYLDSGSNIYLGSIGGNTEKIIGDVVKTEHPLSTHSEERTVWKDARSDSQFVVENYIGSNSSHSVLPEKQSAVSAGDISVGMKEDNTTATSIKSCSRQSQSQQSEQMQSVNSSQRESGLSSPDSASGYKQLKYVDNFCKKESDFIGNIPGIDFYNRAVQQLNAMITRKQEAPLSRRSSDTPPKSSSHLSHDESKEAGTLTGRSSRHSKHASYTSSQNDTIKEESSSHLSHNENIEAGTLTGRSSRHSKHASYTSSQNDTIKEESSSHLSHDENIEAGTLTGRSSRHSKHASYISSQNDTIKEAGGLSENVQSDVGKMNRSVHTISVSPSAERYSSRIDVGSTKVSRSRGEQERSVTRVDSRGSQSSKSNLIDRKSKSTRQSVPFGNSSADTPNCLSRDSSGIGQFFHVMEGLNEGEISENGSKTPRSMTSCSKCYGSTNSCKSQASEKEMISDSRSHCVEESWSYVLEKALSDGTESTKSQLNNFVEDMDNQRKLSFPITPSETLHAIQSDVSGTSASHPVFSNSRRSTSGYQPENTLAEDTSERRLLSDYSSYNRFSLSPSNASVESDKVQIRCKSNQTNQTKRTDQTFITPETSYCTSAKTIPSLASTKDSSFPSSANSFKAVDSAPWGVLPTASKSCPSIITLPTRKDSLCSYCMSVNGSQQSQWKSNLATVIGYMLAFYVLFTILCSAIETQRRSFEGCGLMILDDLFKNFDLRHVGPVCT